METQCEECRGPLQAFTTQVAARKERGLLCRSCFEQKLSVGAPVARQRGTRKPVRVGTGPSASSDSFWKPFRWTPRDFKNGTVDVEHSDFPIEPKQLLEHNCLLITMYETRGDPIGSAVITALFKYKPGTDLHEYINKAGKRPKNRIESLNKNTGTSLVDFGAVRVYDKGPDGTERTLPLRGYDIDNPLLGEKIYDKLQNGYDSAAHMRRRYPFCYNFEVYAVFE